MGSIRFTPIDVFLYNFGKEWEIAQKIHLPCWIRAALRRYHNLLYLYLLESEEINEKIAETSVSMRYKSY